MIGILAGKSRSKIKRVEEVNRGFFDDDQDNLEERDSKKFKVILSVGQEPGQTYIENSGFITFYNFLTKTRHGVKKLYLIICLALISTSIIVTVVVIITTQTTASLRDMQDTSTTTSPVIGPLKSVFVSDNEKLIKAPQDFKQISPEHNTLIIEKHFEGVYSAGISFLIQELGNITHLIFQGTMESIWMRFITSKFPNVRQITLDVVGLNSGKIEYFDTNITFKKLEKLVLENIPIGVSQEKLRKLLEIIQKWRLPNLREFEIHIADLTEEKLITVQAFIIAMESTLEEVSFINCYFCQKCSVFKYNGLQLKIKRIRIFQRRQQQWV